MEVEKDKSRFLFGRAGDHLVTTFQCDLCHFRNITSRSPGDDEQDGMLLHFIRRANLDALWSRERGTIKNTMREIANIRERARLLGFDGDAMLPPMGPHPVEDVVGMGLAVCVLQRSLDVGRNEATVQFSTTQKMKTAYANMWRASLEGSKSSVFSRDTAKMFTTTCPTHGDWNERFSKGMHERMGDKVKQDLGITIEQMHALMNRYEQRWFAAGQSRVLQKMTIFPALFVIIAFCCGLRGEEVPLVHLDGVLRHWDEALRHPTHPHIIVALLGRFKTEVSEKYHLMPLVLMTRTGLEPKKWMQRMIEWYAAAIVPIRRGFVFLDGKGNKARASEYEEDILGELENVQRETEDIIGKDINVFEEFGVSRSFRRGSDAHAVNQGVTTSDIERNNRWRSVETAGPKQAQLRMIHRYADARHIIKALLRYSEPL